MNASALLTAIAEYVAVELMDCGQPAPDRALRYHGQIPADACCDNGYLAVSWEAERPGKGADPCFGPPVFTLAVRYVICWPVPNVNASGVELIDPAWDATAARLIDVADCITRALIRLSCIPIFDDEYVTAITDLLTAEGVRWLDTTPIIPLGGSAGVLWRLTAALKNAGPVS